MSVIIRLQNLPWSANAAHIRRFFSGLNIPEGGVHIVGGENGDAFIGFATDDDARRSMYLNDHALNGASVKLMLSSVSEMQTVIAKARGHFAAANPPPSASIESPVKRSDETNFSHENSRFKPRGHSYFEPNSQASSRTHKAHAPMIGGFENSRKEMAQPPRPPEIFEKSVPEVYWKKKDEIKGGFGGGFPPRPFSQQPEKQMLNDNRYSHQESRDSALFSGDKDNGRLSGREHRIVGPRGDQHANNSRIAEPQRSFNNRYEEQNVIRNKNRAFQEPFFNRDDRESRFHLIEQSQPQNLLLNKPQVFDYGHSADKTREDFHNLSSRSEARNRPYDRNRNRDFIDKNENQSNRYDSDDRAIRRPNKPFDRPRPGESSHPANYRGNKGEYNEEYPNMRLPGHAQSSRPFFNEDESAHMKRSEYMGPLQGGFVDAQYDKKSHFKKDISEVRDFSVRPPWLTEGRETSLNVNQSYHITEPNGFRQSEHFMRNKPPNALMPTPGQSYDEKSGHKRQSSDRNVSYQPPAKQPKSYTQSDPNCSESSKDSNTVIRLSSTPEKTNISSLFQFLKGVKVVLKWGVRAENDKMNRPTGYIFIKCQTAQDADRALTFSNQMYNGAPAFIYRSTDEEFYSSGDSYSFRNVPVPPHVTKGLSYYYGDYCIEITGLKKAVPKHELRQFFEIDAVLDEDIFIGDYSSQMTVIRAFLKLHDKKEADKVLDKSGVAFKDYGIIKTWSISLLQVEKFKKEAKNELSLTEADQKSQSIAKEKSSIQEHPTETSSTKTLESKPSDLKNEPESELNCLEISNLPKFATQSEIKLLFPFISLKQNTIHIMPKINTAVIEFKSSVDSRKALFTNKRILRGVSVVMKQISEARKDELVESKPIIKDENIQGNNQSSTCLEIQSQHSSLDDELDIKPSPSQSDCESPSKKSAMRFEVSVTNLPMGYTSDRVKEFFKGFALDTDDPVILKLSAQGKPLGDATIAFRNAIEADRAIRDLNGRRLAGRSISMKSLF